MSPTEQRTIALTKANRVRTSNARTLNDIRALRIGESVSVVIAILRATDPANPVETITLRRLLVAPRGFGNSRVLKVADAAGVRSIDRPLRMLSRRQRNVMASHLENPSVLFPYSRTAS